MKKKLLLSALLLQAFSLQTIIAQQLIYKAPVLKIDFGSQENPSSFQMGNLRKYDEQGGSCPDDGNYAFTPATSNCFNGDWITMTEDHTPGDNQGNMMLVNAAVQPATFFQYTVNGIKPNTMYEISVWLVNVCRTSSPCNPTPPVISFTILAPEGTALKKIKTGTLNPTNRASWLRYFNEFTTPAGISSLIIKMDDETNGGCGNDFAMDDITLREIEVLKPAPVTLKPEIKTPAPAVVVTSKPQPQKTKPVVIEPVKPVPALKRSDASVMKEQVKAKPAAAAPEIKATIQKPIVPEVLITRTNPVIKTITTAATDMQIDLYDNGEVDGDTVTVYDNNVLLVANAGISEKPVSIKLKIDKQHPHHEVVMVANNLGSIPPNTSLMIITANEKRYEIFISSSKQKNAKIVIDLKE